MSNFNDYWERKRPLTVHELLAEVENIEDDNHYKYDVYITPPADAGNDTDEDSGEEDCQDPDRLNRNQLDAEAELYINDKPVTEENNVEDNTPTTSSIPSNPYKKVRKAASVIQEKPKNLHAVDNSVLDPTDRMAKVRPLMVALNRLFMDYAPTEKKMCRLLLISLSTNFTVYVSISIDESMIPYFGRHGCKQFIRGKPIRFGFKSWVMATRLGYCLPFNLYQGRRGNDKQDCGLGESVVYNFADVLQTHFENPKFSLFLDNFFTFVKLLTTLGERRIGGTGTSAARYSAKEKKKVYIPQSNVVSMYNKYMGGVDQFDNNIATYRISMRGKKWYMPIIMWMFDTAMNNAWRLARNVGKSLDNLTFRREVGQALLKKYGKLPLRNGPTSSYSYPLAARRNTKHIILTNQLRRRCAVCKNKTVKACSTCQVPLHDKCFSAFHPNN
ncbi:hypothetical protein ILUMI_17303 [Ignelater luminosus]|uniref:PiggyBac transposable element-derived protein domain-containing protein n=1 Tax=Ignelater luminosus TaxID=2038154 RepID=A0A8K0G210_IGNLU|nr:hypothetical protein ILUMI_17303 [Ignelater luminosus]